MNRALLLIPGIYFFKTRLNKAEHIAYHLYAEGLSSLLILFFIGNYRLIDAFTALLAGYFTFISFYEIGYFCNDYYAVRWENKPRMRLEVEGLNPAFPVLFILIRVGFFYFLGRTFLEFSQGFILFYAALAASFTLHNALRNNQFKLMTFASLAFLRFFAPFVFFISNEQAAALAPSVLLYYVFYRSLNYLDSKDLLKMPSKKEPRFKVAFYLLLLPVAIVLASLQQSMIPYVGLGYFLLFWLAILAAQQSRLLRPGN